MKNQRNPKPQKAEHTGSATTATNGSAALQQTLAKVDQLAQQLRLANNAEDAVAQAQKNGWAADPVQPTGKLLPVAPYQSDMLAEPLATWVAERAEQLQAPPDYLAVALVTALAGAVGNSQVIKPRENSEWLVCPNLWSALVGEPASMKSPSIGMALAPLYALQPKPGKDNASRLVAIDTTVEKLGVLLADNPHGLLVHRDELSGWIAAMDKTGAEDARSFYLTAHDGRTSYTYDRIMRPTIHIPRLCVSVIGGIQPGTLKRLFVLKPGAQLGSDGFIERFAMTVWPDALGAYRYSDEPLSDDATAAVNGLFARVVAQTKQAKGSQKIWQFDKVGQPVYIQWVTDHQNRLRTGMEATVLKSHLEKYGKLMPSLALLHKLTTVTDASCNEVGVHEVELAIRWTEYLASHAARLYDFLYHQRASSGADLLLKHLRQHARLNLAQPSPVIPVRELVRNNWQGLGSYPAISLACDELEERGWLQRFQLKPVVGRPSEVVVLHPVLMTG